MSTVLTKVLQSQMGDAAEPTPEEIAAAKAAAEKQAQSEKLIKYGLIAAGLYFLVLRK